MKYRVIADIVTTGYVGDIEIPDDLPKDERMKQSWAKAQELIKPMRDKRVDKYDLDNGEFYIDDVNELELVKEGEDGQYLPIKLRK